jgi:carbamoyltransferase
MKIKYRESWRPFAPAVLAEYANDIFDLANKDPYMLFRGEIRNKLAPASGGSSESFDLATEVQQCRSDLPAITHVDFSARVQCVHKELSPGFWMLIETFRSLTGCPVLVNTSFNVRGEPMVCTPADAVRCFLKTDIDILEIGSFLVSKHENTGLVRTRDSAVADVTDATYVLD